MVKSDIFAKVLIKLYPMKQLLIALFLILSLSAISCSEETFPETENQKPETEQPSDNDPGEDKEDGEENGTGSDSGDGTEGDGTEGDGTEGENGNEGTDPENPEPPVIGDVETDRLYGYAQGTTGGEGGKVHHFNDGDKFREWLKAREKNKSTEPAVVWLSGTFTKENGRDGSSSSPWFDIKRTGNLTIYGTDSFRMQNIGFFINESSNIIIRNVHIVQPKADNGADGISMQESHNVWIDHCTFESVNQTKDYEDGSCDVTHETYNVTISWCHFIKTQKSCLVGHSNSATADEKISVTLHHNFFDLSSSRHPRVRFGRAHVYNNYFNQCSTYGVGSAYGARVLVESNLFDGVRLPIDICTYPAKKSGSSWVSNLTGSVAGYVYERNNEFLNKPSGATDPYPFTNLEYKSYNGEKLSSPLTFEDFKPSYEYVTDPTTELAQTVPSMSGVGKMNGYSQAPVEVDNGGLGSSDDSGDGSGDDSGDGSGDDTGGDSGDDSGDGSDSSDDVTELQNGWAHVSCGDKTSSASIEGGKLTITANGKFESGAQSFGYVYREVSGDFEATVQVVSFKAAKESNQGLAGILMTPKHNAESTDFIHAMSARSQEAFYYSFRMTAGSKASKGSLSAPSASGETVIVKLRRNGNELYASYSTDGGSTFGSEKKNTIENLAEKVYIGLAVNSANNETTGTAVFSDFSLNGEKLAF